VNTTWPTTRTLVLAAAAVSAFAVSAPVRSASAQPMPTGSGVIRSQHPAVSGRCAAEVRDLTDDLRQAGLSGQASHVAAELTLGC
jgi:hypothetical protein